VRAIHHESKLKPIATLARKIQNQAKPLASAACVGSVMSPSEVKPEIAKPRQMTAKIAAKIVVAWMEIFKPASVFQEKCLTIRLTRRLSASNIITQGGAEEAHEHELTGAARTARKRS
jgi:hypothetical protein